MTKVKNLRTMLPPLHFQKELHMADEIDNNQNSPDENAEPQDESSAQNDADVTNARHQSEVQKLVEELKKLAKDDKNRGFEIGDRVQVATTKHKLRVEDLVKQVGLSRSRLCDCRMTAV